MDASFKKLQKQVARRASACQAYILRPYCNLYLNAINAIFKSTSHMFPYGGVLETSQTGP